MKQELIGPTATLAAAILSKVENEHPEFTHDIIASAFEDAYEALLKGIARVDAAENRQRPVFGTTKGPFPDRATPPAE